MKGDRRVSALREGQSDEMEVEEKRGGQGLAAVRCLSFVHALPFSFLLPCIPSFSG